MMLAHCLSESRPVRLEGGILSVWFPPEQTFHAHLFEEAVKSRDLEPYVATYFGAAMRLALAPGEAVDANRTAAAAIGGRIGGGTASIAAAAATVDTSSATSDVVSPAASGAAATTRLTPDDIARSRRGAIDDVVQRTPVIDDIIAAFDGEVLDDPQA
jgi:hypothetical protein